MRIIDKGHDYLVDSYDGGSPQHITFMKREGAGYPGNVGHYPGTNCQEVLRVLINRTEMLDNQTVQLEGKSSKHDLAILQKLRDCLWLFEDRAAIRHGFKPEDIDFRPDDIEKENHCEVCGHIICHGH